MSFATDVVARAAAVIASAIDDTRSLLDTEAAVAVKAPAGAGKSYFVGRPSASCGAPARAGSSPRRRTSRCSDSSSSSRRASPRNGHGCAGQRTCVADERAASQRGSAHGVGGVGSDLVVATIAKLGYSADDLGGRDALVIDEAFQADAAGYYAIGGLARTHLLVGDSGQLDPFSTMDNPDRWRGLAEDPLQTAVGALLRNRPETIVHALPISRRLDPRAVALVRDFYPGHPFDAAVMPGVRELRVVPGVARDPRTQAFDRVLDTAAASGWSHLELPDADVLTADPATIETILGLVRRLSERAPEIRGEYTAGFEALRPERIAVGVSHNDQKDYLRASLDAAGLGAVKVDTANKLQGLQFELVVAWHPLAGLPDPDGFHLDPGRLCVLMTRHRQACIVVGRASDRALVKGLPPTTPAYLGWDPDPVLDGWAVHQAVFRALEPVRVEAA